MAKDLTVKYQVVKPPHKVKLADVICKGCGLPLIGNRELCTHCSLSERTKPEVPGFPWLTFSALMAVAAIVGVIMAIVEHTAK